MIKLPKKYAAMKLKKSLGFSFENDSLNKDFDVIAYIVSECYLTGEYKKHLPDGTSKISYDVVFSWNQNSEKIILPEYDNDNNCMNSFVVDKIFDDIETAKNYTREKNNDLMLKYVSLHAMSDTIMAYDEYKKILEKAYLIEKEHLVNSNIDSHNVFSGYDFVKLFLAELIINGQNIISFDKLGQILAKLKNENNSILFNNLKICEINDDFSVDVYSPLQLASFTGLLSNDFIYNTSKKVILLDEAKAYSIINSYDSIYIECMNELINLYLNHSNKKTMKLILERIKNCGIMERKR